MKLLGLGESRCTLSIFHPKAVGISSDEHHVVAVVGHSFTKWTSWR